MEATNDRAAGLGSVFNARKRKTSPTPESMPEVVPAATPEMMREVTPQILQESTREIPPALPPHGTREIPQDAPAAEEVQEPLVVRNTAVYLPVAVLARLKTTAAERQLTYTDLLIDAFDELTQEQLLAACGRKPATAGGMPRGRRGAVRGQGGVQVQLRLDQEQRAWLDEQASALGAPSRSAMVAAVFDAWLPRS